MEEIWKDVVGFESYFLVSNYGNLIVKERNIKKGEGFFVVKEHKIKPFTNSSGYLQYNLAVNGKVKKKYAHRLVADAFIEKIANKNEINHIDGNKKNNFVGNLEWCNREENMRHFSNKYQREQNNRETFWEKSKGGTDQLYTTCPQCNGKMSITSSVCKRCRRSERKSLIMPEREILKGKIKCGNFKKIADEYGVTDNSVRKWCKKYNIPVSSKVIRATSNEGWESESWGDIPRREKVQPDKKVVAILPSGESVIFKNISNGIEFAKTRLGLLYNRHKVNTKHVSDVCNGVRKTAYGLRWKWLEKT